MKNKHLFKIGILSILLIAGCVNPEDLLTENAVEGGVLLSASGSEGKLLGIEDPDTHEVDFTDNDLDLRISKVLGQFNGETFTLVKQFEGQEVVVEDFSELPYTYSINSVAEFLNGFSDISESELRIGDVISFKIKIHLKNGRVVYSNDAKINVNVNCGSDLAGTYTMSGLYNRPLSEIVDMPVGPKDDVITKVGVNLYATTYTGHWDPVNDLDLPTCPLIFSVECGNIIIAPQELCGAYGNEPSGSGYVDEDGNLHLEYQVTGGNLRTYTLDYVKQ